MKNIINFLTSLFLVFIFSSHSYAAYIEQDTVILPKDKFIEESYFATGEKIKIDGNVAGDFICAGQDIEINGDIDGDVICVGQIIKVNGIVTGNVRVAGQYVDINGFVGRNTSVAGQIININDKATLNGELFFGGERVYLNGVVEKKVWGAANIVDAYGTYKKDITIHARKLNQDNAKILGKVYFTQEIEKAKTTESALVEKSKNDDSQFPEVFGIIASFFIGLLVIVLFKDNIEKSIKMMDTRKWPSIGWGILYLIVSPIIILSVMITIIGIPFAIILGLLWMCTFLLAYIYFAIFLGRKIILNYWNVKKNSLPWALIIGVVVNGILFMIPVIGGIYKFIVLIWGLGGMVLVLKNRNKK